MRSPPRSHLFVLIARNRVTWLPTVVLYKCVLIATSEAMISLAALKLSATLKDGPWGIEEASHLVKIVGQCEPMQQQQLAAAAVMKAEENERQRIAKDLHDGVGQMMSAAKMNLSSFENDLQFTTDDQRNSFDRIISLVDESCREVRSVSHQMMPNILLKSGLANAVADFLDKIDQRQLKVALHTEGLNERLDENTEIVLYRVLQECVNNVIKHSGASQLDIALIKDKDGISISIEDNGKGFNPAQLGEDAGIGLKNMKARIDYLNGTIDFDSAPGKGTLVAIHIPSA